MKPLLWKRLRRVAILLVLVGILGCEKGESPPDLSQRATDALGALCIVEGAPLDEGMSVQAHIEEHAQVKADFVTGIRFEISAGGETKRELTAGAIGIADSSEKAQETALAEWLGLFGESYCAARARSPGAVEQGSFLAYPSPLGIRGEHPGGWLSSSETMHQMVLRAVIEQIDPPEAQELRFLNLMVGVSKGEVTGECRIDGGVSKDVLDSLKTLDWPDGTYVFKQNYVLVTASP